MISVLLLSALPLSVSFEEIGSSMPRPSDCNRSEGIPFAINHLRTAYARASLSDWL